MQKQMIVQKELIISKDLDFSSLQWSVNKIRDRVKVLNNHLRQQFSQPQILMASTSGVNVSVANGYTRDIAISGGVQPSTLFSETSTTRFYQDLLKERISHKDFLSKTDSCALAKSQQIKKFSVELSLSVYQKNNVYYFEVLTGGKEFCLEIRNGYPCHVTTFDNFFELYVSAKFFRFGIEGNLKDFDASCEIRYQWPVYVPEKNQLLYEHRTIEGGKMHVQVD